MYSPSKLIAILCVVLLLMPSYAGIITDPMAPISYQPDVRSLGSNTTLVNITTPSSSGLSHNKYDEFDVEDTNSNVIFNNSLSSGSPILVPSLTVSANPNLNRTASIILNEVTGSSLSRLNGAFEIFGDSAALVFANPNGIVVNGGRFFNAYHLAFIAGNAAFDAANQLTSNGTAELEIHDLDVQNNQQITYIGEYITVYGHPKGPDDMMGLHNADEWGVRDGRLVWLAEKELTNHGSISGDHDIHIEAETVNNIDASIDAGGSLYITADTVNNTRTGFWTEYIPPHWASRRIEPEYNGNYEDKACCGDDLNTTWEYWIDRIGDGRESRLSAFGDLVLDVHTTNSTSGLLAAGDDLIVRGHTFNNTARPLHITNKMTWYYSNTYSLWRGPNYMTAVQATTQSIGDSIFELTGDFNNSGQVLSESGISVTANNQVSDTTDPTRTQSPVESLTPIQSFTPSRSVSASQAPDTNIPTFTSSRDSEAFSRFDAPTPPTEPLIDDGIAPRTQDATRSTGSNSIKNSGTLQANQSISLTTSGIASNTGYIDAAYLALQADSFLNELALQTKTRSVKDGKKYKQVQYQELASDGGSINAGTVDIALEGGFRNRGGDIFAVDSLNIFAGGDVINQVQEGQTINTWDTKTWYGSKRGRWAYGSELQSATLASGGDINILTDGIMQNLGSDILATGDVNIFAQGLVEQDWVARTNLIKNSRSGLLGLNKRVEWEHVTETSTIVSKAGDIIIDTGGDFNNRASELHAGQDIDISAKSLNISDDYIQTTNIYRDFKFGFSLPATASVTFSKSSQTQTTHQSSFFSAGRDINLDIEDQLHITGSSLTAEEDINLQADNIKLDAGSYTDSQKTVGFTSSLSAGVGNITLSDTVFGQSGKQTYIIPTALLARNISTDSDILDMSASALTAEEQLAIQTNHFSASGRFQTQVQDSWSFGRSSTIGMNPQQGSFDAVSFGIHASIGHMDKGQYLASNLQAQDINLNISNSKNLDGVIIGDQEHNVRSDYDDSWEHHASLSVGINGTVSASYGQGDWTLSGGTNNIGVQYKDFGLGGFWGEGTGGVSASAYGASLGLSRFHDKNSGNSPKWTASLQYGIFGGSVSIEDKQLRRLQADIFFLQAFQEFFTKEELVELILANTNNWVDTLGPSALSAANQATFNYLYATDENFRQAVNDLAKAVAPDIAISIVLGVISAASEGAAVGVLTTRLAILANKLKNAKSTLDAAKHLKSIQKLVHSTKANTTVVKTNKKRPLMLESGQKATAIRNSTGKAFSSGTHKTIKESDKWLRGSHNNIAKVPQQIVDKMSGKNYKNFDAFRRDFWKNVANDPILKKSFKPSDLSKMRAGKAPRVEKSQRLGGQKSYQLHHNTPINRGGSTYDFGNITIVSPLHHKSILNPKYHYGK